MKNIVIAIVLSVALSQVIIAQVNNMVIIKNDGTSINSQVSDITKIIFVDCPSTVDDADGNTYNTVIIEEQCWMKENLNVGTRIGAITQQTQNVTIEKYCYGDSDANCTTYGGLYQWAEAVQYLNGATNAASPSPDFSGNIQGICPTGWHLPTNAEFTAFSTAVSGNSNTLKAVGQGSGGGAGTNTSGFTVLLVGSQDTESFSGLSTRAYFWSSTYDSENGYNANLIYLTDDSATISLSSGTKGQAFSVRCIMD